MMRIPLEESDSALSNLVGIRCTILMVDRYSFIDV